MRVSLRPAQRLPDFHEVAKLVGSLENFYPGFDTWFWSRAVPSVVSGDGVMTIAEVGGLTAGVVMGRRGDLPKLRCLRVAERYQGHGLALHLMDSALRDLGASHPELTVPEEMIGSYARIFVNRYGFRLEHVARGVYRPGRLEYQFNSTTDHLITGTF